jgi:hypothetical protein
MVIFNGCSTIHTTKSLKPSYGLVKKSISIQETGFYDSRSKLKPSSKLHNVEQPGLSRRNEYPCFIGISGDDDDGW